MIDFTCKDKYNFEDLVEITRILRAPGGCMWDREQDHHSIRRNFLEEAYEAVEAIDNDDPVLLREELGDVLFQVTFHSQIEREEGRFTIDEVVDDICKKMIFRHPHVFGSVEVASTGEVLQNWDELKKAEKHQKSATDTLNSVARSLPQLIRADKVQSKAAKTGFEWPSIEGALAKVREEAAELEAAIGGDGDPVEELGDLLFAVVKVARFLKTDPEQALERTTDKFIARFSQVEQGASAQGRRLEEMSVDEMMALWNAAKRKGGEEA